LEAVINIKEAPMLLNVPSASRELNVGYSTLRKWIKEGRVPIVRLGRRVLVRPEALQRFVREAERRRPVTGETIETK